MFTLQSCSFLHIAVGFIYILFNLFCILKLIMIFLHIKINNMKLQSDSKSCPLGAPYVAFFCQISVAFCLKKAFQNASKTTKIII